MSIQAHTSPNKRYIGSYHYSPYWNQWDKVIGITSYEWIVEDFITKVQRKHCTLLEVKFFADAPFKVNAHTKLPEESLT